MEGRDLKKRKGGAERERIKKAKAQNNWQVLQEGTKSVKWLTLYSSTAVKLAPPLITLLLSIKLWACWRDFKNKSDLCEWIDNKWINQIKY